MLVSQCRPHTLIQLLVSTWFLPQRTISFIRHLVYTGLQDRGCNLHIRGSEVKGFAEGTAEM